MISKEENNRMHTRARGNFIALSGILVAAVLGAVTFFTWEFFGAAEQSSKPRIVYGASGTAYASSRPSRQNVVDHLSAAPLGENKGLKDPEVPAAEAAPDKAPELDRPEPPAQPRGDASVPRIIANSTEKGKWIFIDKADLYLYLVDGNKVIGKWGCATGKVPGNKQKKGDMRTPEGVFSVQQIQDASSWTHDFGDGKGVIKDAYGPWFIRLKTPPHTGIGIHGTHDPDSIRTLASEGCIRLRNDNLRKLKEHVKVGMKVVIGPNSGSAAVEDVKPAPKKASVSAPKQTAKKSSQSACKTAAKSSSRKNSRRK